MPLDPSIILGIQAPQIDNPLDVQNKALTMRHLNNLTRVEDQSYSDDQAMRSAFANNMTTGPDGLPVVNRSGVLSSLARTAPLKAIDQQKAFTAQDLQMQEQKMKTLSDQTAIGKQLVSKIPTDPNTPMDQKQAAWDGLIADGDKYGLPNNDKLPKQYPGDSFVRNMQRRLLTAEEQIAQQNKDRSAAQEDRGLDIKQQEANAKSYEAGMLKPSGGVAPAKPGEPIDPANLVRAKVPPKLQEKVYSEIKDAQNVASIAKPSLEAFDQAAKEVRPFTGGLGTSGTAFIPGMESPGQKAWQGMANTTVKDVEGTARQAAFKSLEANFKPQFGDSDDNVKEKRAGWINYLRSHSSAPVAKDNGIDLTKFPSTRFDPGSVRMKAPDGTIREIPIDLVKEAKAKGGIEI